MATINTRLQKEVYESKRARDILDEEFTEFLPLKRSTNEFFNLYDSKFYDILISIHKFFSEQSLQYIIDYINPKQTTLDTLQDQLLNLQIEIDSIERFHPIFPNQTILNNMGVNWYLIQSGKRRQITGGKNGEILKYIKDTYYKGKTNKSWTIEVSSNTISNIPGGPTLYTKEDFLTPIYTINTGKILPSNIYTI